MLLMESCVPGRPARILYASRPSWMPLALTLGILVVAAGVGRADPMGQGVEPVPVPESPTKAPSIREPRVETVPAAPAPRVSPWAAGQGAGWVERLPLAAGRYRLVSPFGYRVHPIRGGRRFHYGVDLSAAPGEPVLAIAPGSIKASGTEPGFGHWVLVRHPGKALAFYGHLAAPTLLGVGAKVSAGQAIGRVGSSGMSSGPHLHFEIWRPGQGVEAPGDPYVAGLGAVDPERCLRLRAGQKGAAAAAD